MSEENKAIARRAIEEVWNKHNLAAIDEFYAPDVVNYTLPPVSRRELKGTRCSPACS